MQFIPKWNELDCLPNNLWIASFLAMTQSGKGGEAKKKFKEKFSVCGNAKLCPGRAGRKGQNAGQRSPNGRTKRLTFTEGRLRLHSSECTTRLESQAFRQVVRWADGFGLELLVLLTSSNLRFLSREKDRKQFTF